MEHAHKPTVSTRGRVPRFAAVLVVGAIGAGLAPPAPGQELVLGMSGAFTGPSGDLGREFHRGALAYLEGANKTAGPEGPSVQIRALDDGYEPGPAIDNALRLLGDEQVVALFGFIGTPTVTRVLPLLKRHGRGLMLFFAFTGAEPLREPPYGDLVFNLRASYADETAELVDRFAAIGLTRVGLFYQADAFGRSGWSGVREALRVRGLGIAAEATYRRGTGFDASFAEQVEILRGVEVVISVGSYEACAGFIRDARDAGVEVPIANLSFVGGEQLLELLSSVSSAGGRDYTSQLVNSQVVPSYEDLSLPAVREYRQAAERLAASRPAEATDDRHWGLLSSVGFEGFLSAKLMTEILSRVRSRPVSEGLRAAAESLRGFDLGVGAEITYGPGDHVGLEEVYFTTVRDGRVVTLEDWSELAK